MYELDAELPMDYKLTVRVLNSGIINSEIGKFTIDIEDRVLGTIDIRK